MNGSRAVGAVVYGIILWCVLVLAIGGRACTPHYEFMAGMVWLEVYTVFGYVYWIPIILIASVSAYLVASKFPAKMKPRWCLRTATITLGVVAAIAVAVTKPNGPCVYP